MEPIPPPPPSPASISSHREFLTFSDLHCIYCDCTGQLTETRMELQNLREVLDPDNVVSRDEFILYHTRVELQLRGYRAKLRGLMVGVGVLALAVAGIVATMVK